MLLASALALSGCGSTDQAANTSSAPASAAAEDSTGSDLAAFVTLTIPADYVGEITQEELDQTAQENSFKSITLNEDGSATYIMKKSQHKKMMEDLSNSINMSLNEMVESDEYENITDIKTNSDFTDFTIITTSTELGLTEAFSVMSFYMYGGMYHIYNGTPVENIHVEFINSESGKVISSSDSSEINSTE